jgi:hypothetical protein
MIAVFTLIDALGWTYVKSRPILPDVLKHRYEVRTVLGFSSGAIPTLLSGKMPKDSGHWNLFYYDPEHSPFRWVRWFTFLPKPLLNHRVTRRIIRVVSQRLSRFGGYFQIYGVPVELLPYFDICEKKDIYRPGGVPSSLFDQLEALGVRYRTYSYHEMTDAEIVRTARRDLRDKECDFYFLYLSELDAFLHTQCQDRAGVARELDKYENWLREVYEEARRSDEAVAFFVLSDHGMTPKRAGYDLVGKIRPLGFKMPHDYLSLYDSTMARFWFFNDRARKQITDRLNELDCGHILSEAEKRDLGIDFPDHRQGEIVFLMNPGVLIEPSFFGNKAPEGMHGFHPDDPYSSAIFLSNLPPSRQINTLVDVHEVMHEWAETLGNGVHAQR